MNGQPPALDDLGGIVETGEVQLWCSDLGDGEPLFLLGGFTAGHHVWDFVRPYIGWAGERVDPADDPSLALMREAMPQLEVVVIEGAHAGYVLAQRPQDCAEAVLAFLGEHPLREP